MLRYLIPNLLLNKKLVIFTEKFIFFYQQTLLINFAKTVRHGSVERDPRSGSRISDLLADIEIPTYDQLLRGLKPIDVSKDPFLNEYKLACEKVCNVLDIS